MSEQLSSVEYAQRRPLTYPEPIGCRVSALVKGKYVQFGTLDYLHGGGATGERIGYVKWDDGTEGNWPVWALRDESGNGGRHA